MPQDTKNICQILGIRDDSNNQPVAISKLSHLAWISLFFGIASPLSMLLLFIPIASEMLLIVPIVISLASVLVSVTAIIRIVFSRKKRKGIIITFVGLLLGICTVIVYFYILSKVIMHGLSVL